jgi:O-methyltransferase
MLGARSKRHRRALAMIDIKQYTKSSEQRIKAMAGCLQILNEKNIIGDIVECGVWRGGNIILARTICPTRKCWLYDTFEGMTEPGPLDITASGRPAIDSYRGTKKPNGRWMKVSLQDVIANLQETQTYDRELLRFVVGPVEQTLLIEHLLPQQIALLRLDTDWHASTKVELERLYPRLVSKGFLIIDDYGYWQGCALAVNDYFKQCLPPPIMRWIDKTAILIVKP